uniref:Uncharacterized protein n=1 Tax=Anguilla anguilla TaxID=7936 RepID=A0A0E9ULH4_ANGAN
MCILVLIFQGDITPHPGVLERMSKALRQYGQSTLASALHRCHSDLSSPY